MARVCLAGWWWWARARAVYKRRDGGLVCCELASWRVVARCARLCRCGHEREKKSVFTLSAFFLVAVHSPLLQHSFRPTQHGPDASQAPIKGSWPRFWRVAPARWAAGGPGQRCHSWPASPSFGCSQAGPARRVTPPERRQNSGQRPGQDPVERDFLRRRRPGRRQHAGSAASSRISPARRFR